MTLYSYGSLTFAPDTLEPVDEVDTETDTTYDEMQYGVSPKNTGFHWLHPLPPAPDRQSREKDKRAFREHHKYCQYHRLMKKNMHCHLSVSIHLWDGNDREYGEGHDN